MLCILDIQVYFKIVTYCPDRMTKITIFQKFVQSVKSLKSSFLMFNCFRNLAILEIFMVSNLHSFLGLRAKL